MRFRNAFTLVALLAVILSTIGCGSSAKLAQKDRLIAEKDQELARLRSELTTHTGTTVTEKARADKLDADLKKALAGLEAEKKLRVEGNRILLPNAVLFASGSIKITDEGKKVLDEIWNVLGRYPDRDIDIEGHTDNVQIAKKFQGKYNSNWELSAARALAVLHHVRTKPGVKPSRLGAVGYGEHRPIADNGTEEGRKKNRRVVIAVGSKS